jgi:3-oxoadipate CoA-transferase beta subunit
MDLAVGAKRIFVMMDHCTKTGEPKLMKKCTYPLTGSRVVRTVFTDLAVIDVTEDGFVVREITAGVSFEELQEKTDAVLTLSENWQTLAPPDV